MATNIEITTGEASVVLYLQDMSTMTVEANSTKSIQLIQGGFVTISETISAEAGEHPDQTLPTDDDIPEFAEKMLGFWKDFITAVKTAMKS